MGKNKCAYVNCTNNKIKNRNISFFSFPIKNLALCTEWQKNCGNLKIALKDINELKYNYLCETHFLITDYQTTTKRKVLNKNAVPKRYEDTTPTSPIIKNPRKQHCPVSTTHTDNEMSIDLPEITKTYLPKMPKTSNPSLPEIDTYSETTSVASVMPMKTTKLSPNCRRLTFKIGNLRRKPKTKEKPY
uniref:THAP-type domain-containing protein n=1 Tax=Photinus pyralis TaxID=7054 RepID=A0A1Y1KEU2_PHOPY